MADPGPPGAEIDWAPLGGGGGGADRWVKDWIRSRNETDARKHCHI
jgi:hypothetical protein